MRFSINHWAESQNTLVAALIMSVTDCVTLDKSLSFYFLFLHVYGIAHYLDKNNPNLESSGKCCAANNVRDTSFWPLFNCLPHAWK